MFGLAMRFVERTNWSRKSWRTGSENGPAKRDPCVTPGLWKAGDA